MAAVEGSRRIRGRAASFVGLPIDCEDSDLVKMARSVSANASLGPRSAQAPAHPRAETKTHSNRPDAIKIILIVCLVLNLIRIEGSATLQVSSEPPVQRQLVNVENASPVLDLPPQKPEPVVEQPFDTEDIPPYRPTTQNVIQLANDHVEKPSNTTAAVCYKTMFGDIDLGMVMQWAAYNKLLGFDKVILFYRPEMMSNTNFNQLNNLDFVELVPNRRGSRDNYYRQWWTEKMCLETYAADYDWVFVADIDEYLWIPQPYDGIKEFLVSERAKGKDYLSFGKYMYTLDHRIDISAQNYVIDGSDFSHFAVSDYPFFMRNFCYGPRKGSPKCAGWKGRAKVIVDPKKHPKIDVHGHYTHPNKHEGAVHYTPSYARILEFPHIFGAHNITKRSPRRFSITDEDEVHIHNMASSFRE